MLILLLLLSILKLQAAILDFEGDGIGLRFFGRLYSIKLVPAKTVQTVETVKFTLLRAPIARFYNVEYTVDSILKILYVPISKKIKEKIQWKDELEISY